MIVSVTLDDIRDGLRGRSLWCPVARALNRVTNQAWWVGVGVRESGRRGWKLVPCIGDDVDAPAFAIRFIKRFDRGEAVKPFSFTIPDDCLYVEGANE